MQRILAEKVTDQVALVSKPVAAHVSGDQKVRKQFWFSWGGLRSPIAPQQVGLEASQMLDVY
jgi:hypothetical protein